MIDDKSTRTPHGFPVPGPLPFLCLEPTRQGHGVYVRVSEIVAGLERRGWSIKLFAPKYRELEPLPNAVSRFVRIVFAQIRFIFSLRRRRPVLIRTHFLGVLTTVIARVVFRCPTFQEIHGPFEDAYIAWPILRRASYLVDWAYKVQLKLADGIVTVTPQLAAYITRRVGDKRIEVIPNGVSLDFFRPGIPAPDEVALPVRYVSFYGSLAAWQGLEVLTEALAHPDWPEDVDLVVAGTGAMRQYVSEHAKKLTNLKYIGLQPYAAMPGIVAGSIAVLVPKTNLGDRIGTGLSPVKLYEAMACGVPVICSDLPPMAEIVKNADAGIVVRHADAVEIARAVTRIAADENAAREMGTRGRHAVEQAHSWDGRAAATDAFLRDVLGG